MIKMISLAIAVLVTFQSWNAYAVFSGQEVCEAMRGVNVGIVNILQGIQSEENQAALNSAATMIENLNNTGGFSGLISESYAVIGGTYHSVKGILWPIRLEIGANNDTSLVLAMGLLDAQLVNSIYCASEP